MQIKRKIETIETVEIPCESWWKDSFNMYYMINLEGAIIRVGHASIDMIMPDSALYTRIMNDALTGKEIKRAQFYDRYSGVITKLNRLLA